MRLVPRASVHDGLLDVVLTADSSRRAVLAGLPRVFRGTHVRNPALTFLRGREVTFGADRPFTAFADGDPIADLPATVRVVPGGLRVVAP
jgi:diacylglycerol kinase family enzyme